MYIHNLFYMVHTATHYNISITNNYHGIDLPNEGQNDEYKKGCCKDDFCFFVKTTAAK